MTENDFKKLRVGDVVRILNDNSYGVPNIGKIGIVRDNSIINNEYIRIKALKGVWAGVTNDNGERSFKASEIELAEDYILKELWKM